MVGIFNNNGFVLVQAGASSLAKEFGKEDFMGFFLNAMTVVSICTRFANGTILVNVRHLTRVIAVSILATTSLVLIAFASFMKDEGSGYFWVAVGASVLTGMGSGMGEATFLGFLKGFPSHTVGYVSSGTGFAGISGTGTLLIL